MFGKSENGQECGEHEGEDLARGTSHTGHIGPGRVFDFYRE